MDYEWFRKHICKTQLAEGICLHGVCEQSENDIDKSC